MLRAVKTILITSAPLVRTIWSSIVITEHSPITHLKSVTATFVPPRAMCVSGAIHTKGTHADAYSVASNGDSIYARALTFIENNLVLDKNISFMLHGGFYDTSFGPRSGYTTTQATVTTKGSGSVIIDRVIIK